MINFYPQADVTPLVALAVNVSYEGAKQTLDVRFANGGIFTDS